MDLVVAHPFLQQMGGSERVVLEIAKKFNPVIYSVIYEPEKTFPEFKEFDIKILPKSKLEAPFFFLKNDPRRYTAVAAGFRYYYTKIKDDYDVINAQGVPSEWIRNKNERVCWYCHSPNREAYDLREWRMARLNLPKRMVNAGLIETFKQTESKIVPKIERICTNSEVTNRRIKKYLKRDDAVVIHPGIDPKEYNCKSYDKLFFYPSRFVPEKRFEFVIEAFHLFSQKHKGWKLILAGFLHNTERELSYLEELKKRAEGLNVEFKTNISKSGLNSYYASCHAVLFSAINEDWGLVPLEAMASFKPCISVSEGGPVYSIVDGKTGYLVYNSEEMAEKMTELAENPDLVEQMGRAGRKRVLDNYTWKIFLDKIRKEFEKTTK
jgi:glycosyltransferase involved in cell wall biosynthesis